MTPDLAWAAWARERQQRVEAELERRLPPDGEGATTLHRAMRYAVLGGGKRVRPLLAYAAGELAGAGIAAVDAVAVAVEMVHGYSLVHDDLPCMDDDDLRRGRPTCHRAFDEATALLAGDALLTEAFVILAHAYAARPALAAALVRELADSASARRLIGGQMQDLLAERAAEENRPPATPAELEYIHLNKTAAMLEASLVCGGLVAGLAPAALETLRRAGRHLGLAFQIVDDVLDATAATADLGKTAGKDARAGKATYVSLHGLDRARQLAADSTAQARADLADLPGDPGFLLALADRMLTRRN